MDGGHIVLLVSVCLFAENLTFELNIFLELPYYSSYNAHIGYAGSFRHYQTSDGHVKVEYQGYIPQKMAISGAFMFHKHILGFFMKFFGKLSGHRYPSSRDCVKSSVDEKWAACDCTTRIFTSTCYIHCKYHLPLPNDVLILQMLGTEFF